MFRSCLLWRYIFLHLNVAQGFAESSNTHVFVWQEGFKFPAQCSLNFASTLTQNDSSVPRKET